MAHRTRRRAVLRERREHAQERENVRLENIAIDRHKRTMSGFWKNASEGSRLPGVFSDTVFGSGRIRYDDLPDGSRVPGVFGEVVFAIGSVTSLKSVCSFNGEIAGVTSEPKGGKLWRWDPGRRAIAIKTVDDPKE